MSNRGRLNDGRGPQDAPPQPLAIKDLKPGMKNIKLVFIVLDIGRASITKDHHEVRSCKVADRTACVNMSLWDEPGKLLQPGDIVTLSRGYTNVFKSCLTLYVAKGGELQRLNDFCMTFSELPNMSEPNPELGPKPPLGGPKPANGGPKSAPCGTPKSGAGGPNGPPLTGANSTSVSGPPAPAGEGGPGDTGPGGRRDPRLQGGKTGTTVSPANKKSRPDRPDDRSAKRAKR